MIFRDWIWSFWQEEVFFSLYSQLTEKDDAWDDECGGKSETLNSGGAGELYEYPCGLAIAASTKHDIITMNGFIFTENLNNLRIFDLKSVFFFWPVHT